MSAAVKGWCPGALRPMPTGDGLLVRVRISAGRLSLDQAEALASCARDCGNGTIEVSSRGNLQLRGVVEAKLNELQARLADRLMVMERGRIVEQGRFEELYRRPSHPCTRAMLRAPMAADDAEELDFATVT